MEAELQGADAALHRVVHGTIPICIALKSIGTLDSSVPFYVNAYRIYSLSSIVDSVREHFAAIVVTLNARSPIWFSYEGIPIPFDWTLGEVSDFLTAAGQSLTLPLTLNVNFSDAQAAHATAYQSPSQALAMLVGRAADALGLVGRDACPDDGQLRSLYSLMLRPAEMSRFGTEYARLAPSSPSRVPFRVITADPTAHYTIDPLPTPRRRVLTLGPTPVREALGLGPGSLVCHGVALTGEELTEDVGRVFGPPSFGVTIIFTPDPTVQTEEEGAKESDAT